MRNNTTFTVKIFKKDFPETTLALGHLSRATATFVGNSVSQEPREG